eukprot:s6831_g4.t1
MKRLKAQYVRVDPDTVLSSKAWGQRLLNRASLGRRERLDVYYSAGGYEPVALLCQHPRGRAAGAIDGFFRRLPCLPGRPSSTTSRGTFPLQKRNAVHLAEGELENMDEEEEEDFDQIGADFEHLMLDGGAETFEDQQGDDTEGGDRAPGWRRGQRDRHVMEAFAAGWKAKGKASAQKKARGWSKPPGTSGGSPSRSVAEKKKSSTCASCGQKGRWKGNLCCPNVASGQDAPHQPGGRARDDGAARRGVNFVNFTFVQPVSCPDKREWHVVGDGEGGGDLLVRQAPTEEQKPRPMHMFGSRQAYNDTFNERCCENVANSKASICDLTQRPPFRKLEQLLPTLVTNHAPYCLECKRLLTPDESLMSQLLPDDHPAREMLKNCSFVT